MLVLVVVCVCFASVGIVVAFFCSLAGALLSGLCCFMISRHLLYDSLHAWMGGSTLFRAFDSAVEEGGLTFVALIRLSPILPYSVSLCWCCCCCLFVVSERAGRLLLYWRPCCSDGVLEFVGASCYCSWHLAVSFSSQPVVCLSVSCVSVSCCFVFP